MLWNGTGGRKENIHQARGSVLGPGEQTIAGQRTGERRMTYGAMFLGGAQSGGTCRGTAARPVNDEDGQKKLAGKK